jgi:sugar lactone lactonase YvrE
MHYHHEKKVVSSMSDIRTTTSLSCSHVVFSIALIQIVAIISQSQIVAGQGCKTGEFQCANSSRCITSYYTCDRTNDCFDNSDERTCSEADFSPFSDNYVLAVDGLIPGLYQINIENGLVKQLLPNKPLTPVAVAFDSAKKDVYWTDMKARTINKFSMTTRAAAIIYTDTSGTASYDGLALDAGRQLLYYTNGAQVSETVKIGLIGEITTGGTDHRIVRQEVQSAPRGIVVDAVNRIVYWTDWGDVPGIYRAPIEAGTPKTTLVSSDIMWPNALAIDFTIKTMYWADAKSHKIEMANIDGTNRRVIVIDVTARYYGMTLSPEHIYVSDWQTSYLKRVDRKTFAVRNYAGQSFSRMSGLAFYSSGLSASSRLQAQTATPDLPVLDTTPANISQRNATDSWLVGRIERAKFGAIAVVAAFVVVIALVIAAIFIIRRRRCKDQGILV